MARYILIILFITFFVALGITIYIKMSKKYGTEKDVPIYNADKIYDNIRKYCAYVCTAIIIVTSLLMIIKTDEIFVGIMLLIFSYPFGWLYGLFASIFAGIFPIKFAKNSFIAQLIISILCVGILSGILIVLNHCGCSSFYSDEDYEWIERMEPGW